MGFMVHNARLLEDQAKDTVFLLFPQLMPNTRSIFFTGRLTTPSANIQAASTIILHDDAPGTNLSLVV